MNVTLTGFLRIFHKLEYQFVRHKGKINITHPKPPHFERAIVENICVPKFGRKITPQYIPLYDECDINNKVKNKKENPLTNILAKELRNWLDHSQLIAIFHENFMDEEDKFEHYVLLRKNGIKVFHYSKTTVKLSISGSLYEPILSFYQSPYTSLGVCQKPEVYKLMAILKQLPLMTLMGAVINHRLFDYSQLKKFGQIMTIEEARMNFVGVLNMTAQNLMHQLNYYPISLVQTLQLVKTEKEQNN